MSTFGKGWSWQKTLVITLFLSISTMLFLVNKTSLLYVMRWTSRQPTEVRVGMASALLLVPECITFLKALWYVNAGSFWRIRSWPLCPTVAVGLVTSLIELSCLGSLLGFVLPFVPPYINLLFLNSVLWLSFWEKGRFLNDKQKRNSRLNLCHRRNTFSKMLRFLNFLKTKVTVTLLTFSMMIFILVASNVSLHLIGIFVSSIVILSQLWNSDIQNYIHATKNNSQSLKWNLSLLYSMMKILTLLTGLIFVNIFGNKSNIFMVISGSRFHDYSILYWFLLHTCSAIISHITSVYAYKLCMVTVGIVLPAIVSTMLVLPNTPVFFFSTNTIVVTLVLSLSLILWAIPFWRYMKMPGSEPQFLNKPAEQIFINQSLNTVFLEQHALMSLNTSEKEPKTHSNSSSKSSQSKVYICTTMYQEQYMEMDRLIKSLKSVLLSKKLSHVTLEAHIFLDQGVHQGHINQYAAQLISLIEMHFSDESHVMSSAETPYGLRLRWTLPCGTPIFMHMKDPSKVKAKKRWSQVMYMNYILKYRLTTDAGKQQLNRIVSNISLDSGLSSGPSTDTELSDYENEASSLNSSPRNSMIFQYPTSGSDSDSSLEDVPTKKTPCEPTHNSFSSIKSSHSATNTDKAKKALEDDIYILATDADMEFTDQSLVDVLSLCQENHNLGGACGRTHPVGLETGPLVWYQQFEYARDFWVEKSAQNVIGSVMCCPGCFSLYRASAVKDVMSHYSSPTMGALDAFIKDTGEDRWLCTLMMLRGWKMEYSAFSWNTTFCPDNTNEFLKQRRRWMLSTVANTLLIFANILKLAKQNPCFSFTYIIYSLQLFIMSLLGPASTTVIFCMVFEEIWPGSYHITAYAILGLVLITTLVCLVCNHNIQIRVIEVFTLLLMMCTAYVMGHAGHSLTSALARAFVTGYVDWTANHLLFLFLVQVLFSVLLHPGEAFLILQASVYLLMFPAVQLLLPVYSYCNIVDQAWGTRDEQKEGSVQVSCQHKPSEEPNNNSNSKDNVSVTINPPTVQCPCYMSKSLYYGEVQEYVFWDGLKSAILGPNVNQGAAKEYITKKLHRIRLVALAAMFIINIGWYSALASQPDVGYNVIKVVVMTSYVCLFGIQLVTMFLHRVDEVFRTFAPKIFVGVPMWVQRASVWSADRDDNV